MRVVFMGTPQFAVPSLEALAEATEVVGVFTRRDAVSGRGGAVRPSPVKVAAETLGIPVVQPVTLRDEGGVAPLQAMRPDLIVVAAYGLILPRSVLEAAPLGAVNVHASLLPRWRGAAPIQRAILAGDTEAGVSIMRMEEGLDTGPYCLQAATSIDNDDATCLTERISHLGARALVEALPSIADGSALWVEQDESHVTYAEKVSKEDVAIGPELSVELASRRVRASSPAAPCRASIAARRVTVICAGIADPVAFLTPPPGEVASVRGGVLLGMTDGALLVTRLKPDGKTEMAAADWARGVRDFDGSTWERDR